MTKVTSTTKKLSTIPKKYVRLIVTEDGQDWHRLVECKDGSLEYRMGAGKWSAMTARKFRLFVRSIVQAAKSHQIQELALELHQKDFKQLTKEDEGWFMSTLVENLLLADYEFTAYKTTKRKNPLKEILICGGLSKKATEGFKRGQLVAAGANTTRDIANTPALDMTPSNLLAATKVALKGTQAKVSALNEAEMKKLKMNLLLAVGQGTKEQTKLIVIEYYGAGKPKQAKVKNKKSQGQQPIVLVGKGITYDTGGLNVKPTGAMHDMHLDMSGGATVIGAIQAIAKQKLKKNVIGLIPAAENVVSAEAMRAGDIVTAMNGKTVEILHTDAEGRLVLADALTYSERFNPKVLIDVATLTGAALAALGQRASAIMTKDRKLQDKFEALGEDSGDYVAPLPLWDEYQSSLKSDNADISNLGAAFGKFGGAILGGAFLANFVPKKVPWIHIDMAPRMEAVAGDRLAKGATGEPVRLLVKFIEQN